jgi:NDP-sugar pyrophosphorylase family protein
MILAAGLGTRLMPLTEETPKALIGLNGIPMLALAIGKLRQSGFREIIVNIHHHSHMIKEYLERLHFPDTHLAISDESKELLETGGGILNARWFLDGSDPFLVFNVDVITSLDLSYLYSEHLKSGALATLAVSQRESGRYFLFDRHNNLCGWKNARNGSTRWVNDPVPEAAALAFSGIHIISPEIFSLFRETGRFSIVDVYLRIAKSHPIKAFDHTGQVWFDLGKPEQIGVVSDFLRSHPELINL